MPKGALLHAHLEATVDAKTLLRIALEHPNVCIRAPEIITANNVGSVLPEFYPLAPTLSYESYPTITSSDYKVGSYVSARKTRSEWPAELGGPTGFDTWVIKALTVNPEEAYGTHNTTVKVRPSNSPSTISINKVRYGINSCHALWLFA